MPRLAIIIERIDIGLGGAERSVSELTQALVRQGLEVDLLAATGPSDPPNTHILCPELNGQRVGLEVFEAALQKHLYAHAYDWVHSVLPFDFADVYQPRGGSYAETQRRHIASYPSAWVRSLKTATAFTNRRRARLLQRERNLVRNPEGPHVVALSQYVAEQFREHYQCPDARLTVIRNGVYPPVLPEPRQSSDKDAPVIFLLAANNFRLKGLADAIKAIAAIGPNPQCQLHVAGSDSPKPYQRLAQKLGVSQQVKFLGPLAQIAAALQDCDVALLPTYYDPASRFILEALLCHKPVITTAFNGARDHFHNGRHGWVIDRPNNTLALTEAIRELMNNTTRQAMTQAIRADELSRTIHIDRAAQELVALYHALDRLKGHSSC